MARSDARLTVLDDEPITFTIAGEEVTVLLDMMSIAASAGRLSTPRLIDGLPFDGTADLSRAKTCTTAAATKNKTLAIENFTLAAGVVLYVTFTNGNTATAPTLNVSSTGAKEIRQSGDALVRPESIEAGGTYTLLYDGTYWEVVGGLKADVVTVLTISDIEAMIEA